MSRAFLFSLALFISACSSMNSSGIDPRDFSVDSCFPASNEIRIAEEQARRYWQKNATRVGPEPRYLAVEASCIPGAHLNAEFSAKLDRSQTTGSFFAQSGIAGYPMMVYGVLLFDTQTDRIRGPRGYVLVDRPVRGQVIRIGGERARYIGAGG
jgi:hypothetical protein